MQDGNGNPFSIPASDSVLTLKVNRVSSDSGMNNANSYTLLTQATDGATTEFKFDLSGDLTSQASLTNPDLAALELDILTDLNNDSIVGLTVNSQLHSKDSTDASGMTMSIAISDTSIPPPAVCCSPTTLST